MIFTAVIIGFLNTSYNVHESDGEVNLRIGTLNGSLQIELFFIFSFMDSEAVG